jgi:hypothetical protein
MISKKIIVGVGVAMAFVSCHEGVNITAGPQTQEDRVVSTFDEITVDGSMNLYVTQDSSYVIRVEAPENLLGHIKTEVTGNELKVYEDHNHVVHSRTVNVYVSQSVLDRIILNGSGNIEASNIVSSNFNVELNGSGDIYLDVATSNLNIDLRGSGDIDVVGIATNLLVEIDGSGDVDTRNIPATTATVDVDGSGNASVDVSNSLNANIEGSGNIYYWGSPATVVSNVTGSGSVIDMN